MLGAGTFVSAIIRLVTTVGILAAVYFLIIKPVLHTTESISHDINHSVNSGLHSANKALNQANVSSPKVRHKVHSEVRTVIHTSGNVSSAAAQKLLKCVQKAGSDIDKLQACQP